MQQGGSPYEVTQYGRGAAGGRGNMMGISGGHDISSSQHQHLEQQQQPLAEAASPINSRPPARLANFEELLPVGAGGGFPDDEALAGEEVERGAIGNRWPRQETLALLKIRSEMDAAFRDATLKGPLWEEVSRKLAELGFNRSAKKCKEKFENVQKYYKRTKEGRTGRQDGKSYRFFKQLEALHGNTGSTYNAISATAAIPVAVTTVAAPPAAAAVSTIHSSPIVASGVMGSATRMQTQPSSATTAAAQMASSQPSRPTIPGPPTLTRIPTDLSHEISLSSGGSSTSGDSSEEIQEQSHRKRKRSSESSTRRMMNFFEGLMKQVVEKQVALQQKILETIEKKEEDRMIREEAWKRQEMGRLNKELDILAQERAMSASRDAAMIDFLQKFTGQSVHLPPPPQQPPPQQPVLAASTTPLVAIPPVQPQQQQQHHNQHHHPPPPPQQQQVQKRPITSSNTDIVAHEQEPGSKGFEASSSRWPKVEVLALIKLRSGLDSRYQEAGPKGPLWEEISAEMGKMGYKRSAKRCKEKWENINKYFKKVKESNKKRPEDSKTCPYFHQLDTLYSKKFLSGNSSKLDPESPREPSLPPEHHSGGEVLAIMPTPISAAPPEKEGGDGENGRGGDSGSAMLGQKGGNNNNCNNGAGFYSSVVEEGNGVGTKKPEDIVKGLMRRQLQHHMVMDMDDPDSDNNEAERDDEDDDDEEEVDGETSRRIPAAYETQYPRQGARTSTGNAGSVITMVQ